MKRLILICILVTTNSLSYSQSKFEIKTVGKSYSSDKINTAMSTANFCGSYFETKRNVITFNDGSVVELYSKVEMEVSGIFLAASCFLNDEVNSNEYVWAISEEDIITKGHSDYIYVNKMFSKILSNKP
jgi:hypothetical protein